MEQEIGMDRTKFFLIGDNLSLDFVNTEIVEGGRPKDLLTTFEDLAAWAVAVGLLKRPEAEKMIQGWRGRREAGQILRQALDFRRILREMATHIASDRPIKPVVIKTINTLLRGKRGYSVLVKTGEGFEKRFRADFREPQDLFCSIADAAADLLSYGNPAFLKKCQGADCILYFYDNTKNHSRRWCSMAACGNRAKAAAFYHRRRQKISKASDGRKGT
jgi:predicted RNA-binding Zn ribbon-like protein